MNISGASGVNSSGYYATVANATQSTVSSLPSVFSNLNLSPTQQTQIGQFLQNAQNGSTTPTQLQSEIESVLNPQQLSQLKTELQGHHHHHHGSQSKSSSNSSSDEDAFGITTPTSTSSAGTQSISDAIASYWTQSQITPQSQT